MSYYLRKTSGFTLTDSLQLIMNTWTPFNLVISVLSFLIQPVSGPIPVKVATIDLSSSSPTLLISAGQHFHWRTTVNNHQNELYSRYNKKIKLSSEKFNSYHL